MLYQVYLAWTGFKLTTLVVTFKEVVDATLSQPDALAAEIQISGNPCILLSL
jgi:hypothetical protein